VIESQWGARFSAPVQTGPAAHPASCKMGTGSFPGIKRPGRGDYHPPPSSAKIKSSAILLLTLWAFVACSRVNFTFIFTFIYIYVYIYIYVCVCVCVCV